MMMEHHYRKLLDGHMMEIQFTDLMDLKILMNLALQKF